MAYNRQTAIDAIARLAKRQSQKKDVEFKSFKQKKREERELKIKTLKKQIKSLDNVLENMTNKKWDSSDSDEVIIFRMRQVKFRKLQTLKSAARNAVKH
jgi:uncharacterized lipoprotein YehR (DUF1307 family)